MNLSSSMIALSILGGGSANPLLSGAAGTADAPPLEGPKARLAKKAFTTVKSPAPWDDKTYKAADPGQLTAIRVMRSIIDTSAADHLPDDADLRAAFVAYRALDRLQVLAQGAAKAGISSLDRAQLQRSFDRGLAQLRSFVGSAKTDKLTLYYGQAGSTVQSFAFDAPGLMASGVGDVVAQDPTTALKGLTGHEVFELHLGPAKGERETIKVDLSTAAHQPPSLRDVVDAINTAIAASPKAYSTRFEVRALGEKRFAIGYRLGAGEGASLSVAGAGDALLVSAAHRGTTGADALALRRYGTPQGDLTEVRLVVNEVSVDRKATALAAAEIDAKAAKRGKDYVKPDPTVNAGLTVKASASDADGNSYLVGTAAGDYGVLRSNGTKSLFLAKVDGAGHVLWRRALSAASDVDGAAVSVDTAGNVSVAGSVAAIAGDARTSSVDANMIVARYSATGDQLLNTIVSNPGRDVAHAITTDADGNVIVAGSGTDSAGNSGGLIIKINAAGHKVQRIHLADASTIDAIATDPDGHVVVLTREGGASVLHRYDADLEHVGATFSLGAGVQAGALAIAADGRVAVTGGTSGNVAGSAANSRSGGRDAFVTLLARDLTGARTSYIGGASDEVGDSLAFSGSSIYVGGRTYGALSGERRGGEDGFVARVAVDSGSVDAIDQFGTKSEVVGAVQVDVIKGGSTDLGRLGLASGELAPKASGLIVGQTGIKPLPKNGSSLLGGLSDTFRIQVDGGAIKTISIEAGDTLKTLRDKIGKVAKTAVMVSTPSAGYDKASLKISVLQGHKITLLPGKIGEEGGDALVKLGLTPGTYSAPKNTDVKVTPGGRFGLNLDETLSLGTRDSAGRALEELKAASGVIKNAYASLFWTSAKAQIADGRQRGGGSTAAEQAQLARYQDALARLTAGSASASTVSLL